jgi:hypothetical protein
VLAELSLFQSGLYMMCRPTYPYTGWAECLRHGGKDLEAEGAPQPDRRRIGFDNRIELHRPVAVCACLVQDMPTQSTACALAAPRRMDHEPGTPELWDPRLRAGVPRSSWARD